MQLNVSKRMTTIDDVIRLLPFESEFRDELLKNITTYPEGTREEVKNLLWEAFHEFVDSKVSAELEIYEKELAEGKTQYAADALKKAQERIWSDFDKILAGQMEHADSKELIEVREKLSAIIQRTQ